MALFSFLEKKHDATNKEDFVLSKWKRNAYIKNNIFFLLWGYIFFYRIIICFIMNIYFSYDRI